MIFFGKSDCKTGFKRSVFGAVCGLVGVLVVPTLAVAKPFITQAGQIPAGDLQLSPLLGAGYDNFVEVGFVASWLVVPHGFIPPLNNSVHAEAAVFQDVAGRDPTGSVGGRMRWDFHLHPKWTAYGAPGFAIRFGDKDRHTGLQITGVVGGFFHMTPKISLRAESDAIVHYDHAGLRGGITFHL